MTLWHVRHGCMCVTVPCVSLWHVCYCGMCVTVVNVSFTVACESNTVTCVSLWHVFTVACVSLKHMCQCESTIMLCVALVKTMIQHKAVMHFIVTCHCFTLKYGIYGNHRTTAGEIDTTLSYFEIQYPR